MEFRLTSEVGLTETHLKGPPRWGILEETPLLLFFKWCIRSWLGIKISHRGQASLPMQEVRLTWLIQKDTIKEEKYSKSGSPAIYITFQPEFWEVSNVCDKFKICMLTCGTKEKSVAADCKLICLKYAGHSTEYKILKSYQVCACHQRRSLSSATL